MLVPIGHENMSARRWPVITIGLILVNLLIFASTHRTEDQQDSQLWKVEKHILILAATHPNLVLTHEVRKFVTGFQAEFPDVWAELQNPNSDALDEWDARTRLIQDPVELQEEMDSLGDQYSQLAAASITERYAFIPAHPSLVAYVSSNFLHGGWLHLIFNMWFLWLAGFVLEDAWGRPLYLFFYLVAGVVSTQFDAWANPGSIIPSLGASGAVAGLMGGFLVRFPKMKIRMMWFFDLGLFPFSRFWMRAYWLLPIWVLMEIKYGMASKDGIGHWAHVGGFFFGAVAAVAVRYSGLERKVNRAIEEKVAWAPPAAITQANELMEHDRLDEAAAILNDYLATEPESVGGWNLLLGVHWRNHKIPECREAAIKLCVLHLQAGECEAAWQDYNEFLNLGGDKVSPAAWLELCHVPEQQQDFERAVSEYDKLAAAYPSERQSVLAHLCAARICLNRLNRPVDALRFYEAAETSAVPHLDLELEIESGIRETRNVLADKKSHSASATSTAN
jgi:membrane associated rhomboid family serine protease